MKNLLIIDGNSILNRAYYAIRPLSTKDGLFTHAVYGFVNILLKHLESIQPDYGVVAFDLPAPTFRHKEYEKYKATRKGMPDELAMQLPYAKQCAELLGFKVLEKEGYEADDIIGTVANISDDLKTYILTGDRDSLQLITDNVNILLAVNSDTIVFDKERFIADYGIEPSVFVNVKALMGDSSDNIPGVAGIGEKTALKLISSFGSLDKMYEAIDAGSTGKEITKSVCQKLLNGKDDAYMSKFLACIDKSVPLDLSLEDLIYNGFQRAELLELFTKLEFIALIKRLNLTSEIETIQYEKISIDELNKFVFDTIITIEIKNNVLYIVTDTANYSCSYTDIADLKDFLENKNNKFCVYDSKNMYKFLRENDINLNNCEFDIILAAYVLNSSDNSYDIARLSTSYLNTIYDESESDVAYTTHQLYKALNQNLIDNNQYDLFKNIELPLAKVLADMEIVGFKVDRLDLVNFASILQSKIDEYAQAIYDISGEEFNINSPKQLGEILFNKLQLPVMKKKKTGYSTDAEVLEKLRPYSPIINYVLEYRQVAKLKSTYVDGLLKVADSEGRIHTTFNQTVTATGRLSSTEPNLQNIPIRQELGRELRKSFIPESRDYVLVDADYSQIELRLLADISNDKTMKDAFKNNYDIHTITASQVFNVDIDNVTPELRKRAKAVNFGIVYGISDFSLGEDIGVSKYHAGEYIKSYFEKYPGVDNYMKSIVEEAHTNGYVTTKFGRRRYIPELKSSKAILRSFGERVAMNSPIQGTAADIIKIAMINTVKALKESGIDARLILQVHDELVVESHKDCQSQAAQILKQCMEGIDGFDVPLTVEITIGDNWYH